MLLVAAASVSACQKKKGEEKKQEAAGPAASSAPLDFDEVQKLLPDTLAGLPRQLVAPTPEIPQVSAYYQDTGNTKSGHVIYTIVSDPARTLKYYEGRFSGRATIDGRTAFTRQWKPKASPETAEGCLLVGERIGVCVDIAPGTVAELPPLFEALPLAEIEKRAPPGAGQASAKREPVPGAAPATGN